jgi:hypothetical protein
MVRLPRRCNSMRSIHLPNTEELIERADRWPAIPIVVLLTSCVVMTVAAVFA